MSLRNFLTSRTFLKHLLFAFLLIAVIIFITLFWLKMYTLQSEVIEVPDFTGLTEFKAETLAEENHLRYEITDSLHFAGAEPGAIVEQVPEPGLKVKKNRVVYLVVNSTTPEKVILPKLSDISFRQAQAMIENCGLKTGNITFEASEFNDLVLKVKQNSLELNQGDEVVKGSLIDIVIGKSSGNIETSLPDLMGLSLSEAKNQLSLNMLNTGVLIYTGSLLTPEDTAAAVVWKQYPSIANTNTVSIGSSVDLWLTGAGNDSIDTTEMKTPEIQ
jgi:beta-lactam-binding protein with PASTA domain